MHTNRKIRIALECRIEDPRSGVGSAVLALARAFSETPASDQEYTFIVNETTRDWLQPHVFGPCSLISVSAPAPSQLKVLSKKFERFQSPWHKAKLKYLTPPKSDGYVESQNFDIVHFLTPAGYLTSLPTIYQPHDLQHLHYPEYFSKYEFAFRDKSYRVLCQQARAVCVHTEWCKEDVVHKLKVPSSKVAVVKWGCVLEAYESHQEKHLRSATLASEVPATFFLYPAVTWPHKNHECILRALKQLSEDHGVIAHVCFTGRSTEHRTNLDTLASQLEVSAQIHFLGFVTPLELSSLFCDAVAMIYPSKFEGFGLPILEAFRSSLPVICAHASCLPEVAQDAALYFDPESPKQLALRMLEILNHPEVGHRLIQRGHMVLGDYSFKRTAAEFREIYRRIAENSFGGEPAAGVEYYDIPARSEVK